MNRQHSLFSSLSARVAASLVFILIVALVPPRPVVAGITFLPGTTRSDILPGRPDVSVLSWELPDGLLIVDRLTPERGNRFGEAFKPAYNASEWYLIQPKAYRYDAVKLKTDLKGLAQVHLDVERAMLVEVPLRNLEIFDALSLERVRIPMSAPPVGWDRYPRATTAAPTAVPDDAMILALIDNISGPAFNQTIQEISGWSLFWYMGTLNSITTRYYNTADKDLIADFLGDKLAGYGYTVQYDTFTYGGHTCRNIVATKTGTIRPTEYVVVGGHYDSYSPTPAVQAPGAEDNASGAALVMEMARVAAARDFDRSVQFVLFDTEEVGLVGSTHFVDAAITAGRNIVAAITCDMVAFYNPNYRVRIEGQTSWEWLMTIMEGNVNVFTDIGNQKDYYSWGSDHVPFQQAGIPAFLAIDFDYGSYSFDHTTNDTWSRISGTAAIGVQIGRACLATLADVAVLLPTLAAVELPEVAGFAVDVHPNPFNPRTVISFEIPDPVSRVRVEVFDLRGQLIRRLTDESYPAGRHEVVWNGRNDRGEPQSSGQFIYRLEAGSFRKSGIMTLLK